MLENKECYWMNNTVALAYYYYAMVEERLIISKYCHRIGIFL